jgi:predicted transcriptional regulator
LSLRTSKLIEAPPEVKPSLKDVSKENEIVCLLCGKAYAVLGPHLSTKHNLTGDEYRDQFGIPLYQPLVAISKYEDRKRVSIKRSKERKELAKLDAKVVAPPTPASADVTLTKRGRPGKVGDLVCS